MRNLGAIILFFILCISNSNLASAQELTGFVSVEGGIFANKSPLPEQKQSNISLAIQTEFYYEFMNGSSFTFTPFARIDWADSRRTHYDIRELNFLWVKDKWELTLGVDKVFWGVTEFVHLVDIINQTDLVESIDMEEKLGQAMVHLSVPRNWGILDLFVLPIFRERTFPGAGGRPRHPLLIDTDNPQYESTAKEDHVDFAIRYSHSLGNWDIGVSHFYGTNREPTFVLESNVNDEPSLIPYYDLINQTSMDVQLVVGEWLFKLESFNRSGQGYNFFAAVGGFEYSLTGFAGSKMDIGLIGEWIYDSRGRDAATLYDNDALLGIRFGLNNMAGSNIIIGSSIDANNSSCVGLIEGSTRIGSNWKTTLTGRGFFNFAEDNPFYYVHKNDFVRLEVAYYF
jgi:hypothetical protein